MTTQDEIRAKTTPQLCPRCQHSNRVGVIFCEKCGKALTESAAMMMATGMMTDGELDGAIKRATGQLIDISTAGRGSSFHPGMVARFSLKETQRPIDLMPAVGSPVVFGRVDPDNDGRPDVNLMPYGGLANGISRRHASITLVNRRLLLMDMGSSNGTFINEQPLRAHKPVELRDGDIIRMGLLIFVVTFRR